MIPGSVGRPGTGGRLPFASPHTATTATRALYQQFGDPLIATSQGVTMLSWVAEPDGDGIVFARLSGRDLQRGETAMLQIHPGRDMAERLGLRPRLLIVTTDNTGARDYGRRPDFAALEQARDQGWLRWVCWRDQDRIAREPMPFEQCMRTLLAAQIDLYLVSLGRRVDWAADRLLLRTLGTVSAEEREKIAERTHRALRERWLKEGRGWPSARRFGFRRNPVTKFLEVDPEQWEFVKRIHLRYAELQPDSAGRGVTALSREMTALGCELSPAQIRRILRDRIYVDGTWSVSGHPGRDICLDEPIPEAVFQRNQELLGLRRGRTTRTVTGQFALNGVPVVHAACRDLRDRTGRPTALRGRKQADRPGLCYRHAPWVPDACRGFSIDGQELDAAVAHALADAAQHPTLIRVWRDSTPVGGERLPPVLNDNEERALRDRVRRMRRQLTQLRRLYRERLVAGERPEARAYLDLVADLEAEIERGLARSESARRTSTLVGRASRADDLAEAMHSVLAPTSLTGDWAAARSALVRALTAEVVVSDLSADNVSVTVRTPFA